MFVPEKDFAQSGPDGRANEVRHMDARLKTQDSQSRLAPPHRAYSFPADQTAMSSREEKQHAAARSKDD
jgi:hypothetical protein